MKAASKAEGKAAYGAGHKTGHTPGPWHAAIDVQGCDSQVVDAGCVVATVYTDRRALRSDANARLIAAAPRMLEVVRAGSQMCKQDHDDDVPCFACSCRNLLNEIEA